MTLGKDAPVIKAGVFVAPSASVIGRVQIGQSSSVWYGAVVRGDVNSITIGDGVSVGDRAMIHCSGIMANRPTVIGHRCVIGAGAIVHGCTLEDESFVGEGAQVLDGAKVQKHAMVAAGAVVGQGKVVASGQLWAGVPAVHVRDLTAAEKVSIAATAADNVEWAAMHAKEAAKSWATIAQEEDDWQQVAHRNEYYYKRLTPKVPQRLTQAPPSLPPSTMPSFSLSFSHLPPPLHSCSKCRTSSGRWRITWCRAGSWTRPSHRGDQTFGFV